MPKAVNAFQSIATQNLRQQLSPRELEVLKLVVEGHSNPKIAAILYLSQCTIKSHIRSIFNKLGVTDRTQAAVFAVRNRLI